MVLLDTTQDISQTSISPTDASTSDTSDKKEGVLSFSQLLKGMGSKEVKEDTKQMQNGALILALEGDTQEIVTEKGSTKSSALLSLLQNDDTKTLTSDEPLVLNPKVTGELSTKEMKLLVNDAKEFLKTQITQSDDYKQSQINDLPKTLKGLVDVAKLVGIDVSKISVEEVRADAQVKKTEVQLQNTNRLVIDTSQKQESTTAPTKTFTDALNIKQEVKSKSLPDVADAKQEVKGKIVPDVEQLQQNLKTKIVPDVAETQQNVKAKVLPDVADVKQELKAQTQTKQVPDVAEQKQSITTKTVPDVLEAKQELKAQTQTKQVPDVAEQKQSVTTKTVPDVLEAKQELKAQTQTKLVPDVAEQKQEMKSTPLFKAQSQTEHSTQQLVESKAANTIVKVEEKTPKSRADETLKLLLRGEKPQQSSSANMTADFSVATAKVLAPTTQLPTTQVTQTLEQMLRGESSESKSETSLSSKTEMANIPKADSLEIKLNEAKQMVKYLSNDVKTAIEDYKSPFTRVKVQLNPQNLGEIDLTVVQRGKNLHVNLSSNNAAINALALNINDLKAQLSNNGINNATFNFSNNQDGGNSASSQQQQQRQNEQQAREEYNYFDNEEKNEEILDSLEIVVPTYI